MEIARLDEVLLELRKNRCINLKLLSDVNGIIYDNNRVLGLGGSFIPSKFKTS